METRELLTVVGTFTMTKAMSENIGKKVKRLNATRKDGQKRFTKADVIREALECYLNKEIK